MELVILIFFRRTLELWNWSSRYLRHRLSGYPKSKTFRRPHI